MGHLNLVDLAGSERVSQTNATGQVLKEAQAINKWDQLFRFLAELKFQIPV